MKKYLIYLESSIGADPAVAEIEAMNPKQALVKFRQGLTATGMYEYHKVANNVWELSSSYGKYWYCVPKEGTK